MSIKIYQHLPQALNANYAKNELKIIHGHEKLLGLTIEGPELKLYIWGVLRIRNSVLYQNLKPKKRKEVKNTEI